MFNPLDTYLSDHIGGAQIALQLLEGMRDRQDDPHFREFAGILLPEIEADDRTLRAIKQTIGGGSNTIKSAGGWLLEKASRLKLGHTGSPTFELFESFELLALGIRGKLCLWRALQVASQQDPRLRAFDYDELIRRAEGQYQQVEHERLDLADRVFASS
jgi:hypothetical protein